MSWSELLSNPVFAGGLGLGALGAAGVYGRQALAAGARHLMAQLVTNCEVRDRDMVEAIDIWIAGLPYGQTSRRLSASLQHRAGSDDLSVCIEPGFGLHSFLFDGHRVLAMKGREQDGYEAPRPVYTLRATGGPQAVQKILSEAERARRLWKRGRSLVYVNTRDGEWELRQPATPRRMSSVILREGLAEDLLQDAAEFFAGRDEYARTNTPWRRGWWFRGPRGTGKTSIGRAVAEELEAPLYALSMTADKFGDAELERCLGKVPPRSVVMLEELDEQRGGAVSVAGLRTALDGPTSSEGRLVIITTNSDRLDPSLRRSGRIDREEFIGFVDRDQARRHFLLFFPGRELEAQLFASEIPEDVFTPADLQRHMQKHRRDPAKAAREAKTLAAGHHREEEAA